MLKRFLSLLVLVMTLGAGGCGEQLTTPPSPDNAEGLWSGTTNTGRTLTTAVLDDGSIYIFYSAALNANQLSGVIQGTGTTNNGSFISTDTKDFGIGVAALDASLSATFTPRQFFNGSISYQGTSTVTFTGTYNTAYDTTPTLASLAGVYSGQAGSSGGVQPSTVTAAIDGTFTGTEQNGCTFTGTTTARTRGNVFDQTITFGGAPCFFSGKTFQGIVYFDNLTRRLYSAAPNSLRTDAAIFFGTKIL